MSDEIWHWRPADGPIGFWEFDHPTAEAMRDPGQKLIFRARDQHGGTPDPGERGYRFPAAQFSHKPLSPFWDNRQAKAF
jgi:hypothetical protein